jgi:hypothetical protein
MPFIVARSFRMPVWNEETRSQVKDFWQTRRAHFTEESERMLKGYRSHLLCNLYAMDPAKIKASLVVTWMEPGTCDCLLTINTAFQIITEWNKAYFQLEMATFESFIAYGQLNGDLWRRFLKAHDVANIYWCASGGILGYRMSCEERRAYLTTSMRRVICHAA